jgi:hypothetical protein
MLKEQESKVLTLLWMLLAAKKQRNEGHLLHVGEVQQLIKVCHVFDWVSDTKTCKLERQVIKPL